MSGTGPVAAADSDVQAEDSSWRMVGETSAASYYRARYYDPQAGRFSSEDPIGFRGGMKFYSYSANNPVNLIDPFGLNPAPSIPWPLPWFPPGSVGGVLGGVVEVVGKLAIPITAIYELTFGAKPMGIDDARVIPKPKPCDKGRNKSDCDKEWADAYATCRELLALPHPPRGITGGYTNVNDCARGLVSEECGGNPVSGGKK